MDRTEQARRANERGDQAKMDSRLDDAELAYRQAIVLAPSFAEPWFGLSVLAKRRCRWDEARWCAERALALGTGNRECALWILAAAATALGDWRQAREAWKAFGFPVPEGEGPIEMALGMTPVRMRTSNPEAVWCQRLDPVRAVVQSIPVPESGRRFGDMLLHDCEARGYRKHGDAELPVFDEIELLVPSSFSTYRVQVRAPSADAVGELIHMLDAVNISAEDWTWSVRNLCKECSEGSPHAKCPSVEPSEWAPERSIGIAAMSAKTLERLLERWCRAGMTEGFHRRVLPGYARTFQPPECVVEGAARA